MNIKKVLVANRGEIAVRVFRACVEMGLSTVAIYTYEDRYSLHRYKADEAYQIGADNDPLKPYLAIDEIVNLAKKVGADAIHPGYGFLSENVAFARKCAEEGIIFIGPRPEVMEQLGDKIAAKEVARKAGIPIIEDNQEKLTDLKIAKSEAKRIGYPIMLKAAAGGGGRGMRVVHNDKELERAFREARSEAGKAFGDDTIFMEKYIANPKHIEVQIVADNFGNTVHLYERDCSLQRRFQKVVEIAPSLTIPGDVRDKLYYYAVTIARSVNYNNIGTVEFLVEEDDIYFIEVNPRIQVEHTVTEMITGIDLVKTQLYIASGFKLNQPEIGIPSQGKILKIGYALQCRITTEDPANDFRPDYGTITAYRSAAGFGIRLDMGSVYQGSKVSPFFDSMLVKVSAHAPDFQNAVKKMDRALQEFRIRGVKTNMPFLINILRHEKFKEGAVTVNFIKEHPEIFEFWRQQDRGTKTLRFLSEMTVNGNPDVKFKDPNKQFVKPVIPTYDPYGEYTPGSKDLLTKLGPDKFSEWLRAEKKIHYTDTTLRDAHQSLIATRMRTLDMEKAAESFARHFPQTFSMEVWGGATFDVCLRFLYEDPWERLATFRKAVPNILLQMLLRGSNGVGYTAYPDNLIEKFVEQSWETGIDVFRIFDSLNWMNSIAPCVEHVRNRTKGLAEASICYTGDILRGKETKYNLDYYIQLAKDIENAGAHILAIKDMAGLLKPYAAKVLVEALRDTVKLPIHLHTHDTSSMQPATYLMAIEAGVDVVDVAIDSMSGMTSQPNFNSVLESMRYHGRENEYDARKLGEFSGYWERVREYYYPFESGLRSGTASVYHHEIPGGQYSNLRRQALELGLMEDWERIMEAYAEVNELFGDIIKVTPSSKVVGDMALLMVSKGLTKADILKEGDMVSYPESVKAFFRGDLGQPYQGFPEKLQKMVLKDEKPYSGRPNEHLAPVDFKKEFKEFVKDFDRSVTETDFLSWKLYPKVFEDYFKMREEYGDVSRIPSPYFFFGMKPNEETTIEIAPGKTILVELLSIGNPDTEGYRTLFFKLNGQNRNVRILDKSLNITREEHKKADPHKENEIGSPLQGMLSKVMVKPGDKVKKNQALFIIEAMKMENTVVANENGSVDKVILGEGTLVQSGDLVVALKS